MTPLIADLPYPSTDGLFEDKKSAKIIAPAYAAPNSELTAVLQYIFHRFYFEYNGMAEIAKALERIAVAEMRHLDILGGALMRLGVSPVFSVSPPQACNFFSAGFAKYSTYPVKMIMDDIQAEREAIDGYENMLARLENQQVAAIIQRILIDEKLHLKVFCGILEKISG